MITGSSKNVLLALSLAMMSLEMLAHVSLAEEGMLRMLLAVVYLMSCKVGNDNEVSAASREWILGLTHPQKLAHEESIAQVRIRRPINLTPADVGLNIKYHLQSLDGDAEWELRFLDKNTDSGRFQNWKIRKGEELILDNEEHKLKLLALGTSFATKMIREYGLLQHKKDGLESWEAGAVQNSFLSSELVDSRADRIGDLERLQKMAHFLEIIRNLQGRLTYKFKRLGQELVDQGEGVGETDLSQDESRILNLPADILSLEASNQNGLISSSEMERNNGEDLAVMPVDSFDSKDISSLDTFKEPYLISEEKRVFSIENPKDMIARWEVDDLDVKTVVKDAILSGRLPLAVLKLHLHRSRDLMSDQENQDTFNEVREVGRAIAYDLFLKGETGLAVETLQRLGEDIETSLKQLVFGTVWRSLRMQIVEVMKGLGYLGAHEWQILERISLIERVYPCSSFWSTFSCRHKEFKGVSNGNATKEIKLHLLAPLGRDLVIACGELDGVVLGSWMNVSEQPIAPEADNDSTHSSYWSAAAVWFDVWDQRFVDCIVLDQPFLMGVNVLWESQLDYHIRHSDWSDVSRLLEVIPSYALTSGSLSVCLDGIRSSSVDEYLQKPHDCSSYIYSLEEVDAVCVNVPSVQIFRFSAHSMCSMWLLMLMERELAKRFIFLKDYWGSTTDIVALLSQSGFIYDVHKSMPTESAESWSESVLAISDARTHPDSIQAFHKVIVHYCSQHNLLNFLDIYLDHHKLALDHESVSWMQDAAVSLAHKGGGDPLSPFLFILVMEGLNNMIKIANREGWLRGFEVARTGRGTLEITHLQYADDTLIFCDAEEEQLRILRLILVIFERMSGLHVNWSKSFLYPVNVVPNIEMLKAVLGGEVGNLPTIYLGLPLGAKSKSMEIWNGVIEKCDKKLAGWKSQYLSLGGRLALINSVLDALPTYLMSLFPVLTGIINRLDSIRRKFLWQRNKERKGYHLVK
ncbi:hypothetical protein FXO37_04501 [Capsicum annuum]|nr:hypothetical protein FXO37_04501 [Capsicum annuum]